MPAGGSLPRPPIGRPAGVEHAHQRRVNESGVNRPDLIGRPGREHAVAGPCINRYANGPSQSRLWATCGVEHHCVAPSARSRATGRATAPRPRGIEPRVETTRVTWSALSKATRRFESGTATRSGRRVRLRRVTEKEQGEAAGGGERAPSAAGGTASNSAAHPPPTLPARDASGRRLRSSDLDGMKTVVRAVRAGHLHLASAKGSSRGFCGRPGLEPTGM